MENEVKESVKIVVPGEVLAEGMDVVPGDGTFRDGEKIIASVIGLPKMRGRSVKVIPLVGEYIPKVGDFVIGIIEEVMFSSWVIDINSPYAAMMPLSGAVQGYVDLIKTDVSRYFDIDDWIYASIIKVSRNKQVQLSMKNRESRKLSGGELIKINPKKIPRVIGKRGSMIKMLISETNCKILVGQNGVLWIDGSPEMVKIVKKSIRLIERESHVPGLTDRVSQFLNKNLGRSKNGLEKN